MQLFLNISKLILPMLIVSIIAFGMWKKIPVYDSFVEGAEAGMKTVLHLIPTMIGLMLATGVLRASGFLDLIAHLRSRPQETAPFRPVCFRWRFCGCFLQVPRPRIAAGCLSEIWTGFTHRSDRLPDDVEHRNDFLYDECIFPERERKKDTVYASGCAFCDRVWDRGERRAGWMDMRIIGIEVMIRNC